MNFLSFFQFMVYRKGDTIVLTYGLVTHSVYELPVSRINAVRIKQSLQARIFKKYCLEVVNAGLGDEKDEKQVLCLYVNRATLLHLMHQLLPEYKLDENAIRQPKTALLLSLPTVLIVSVFLGVLAYYLTPWCLIALPLTMLIPFLRSFTLSLATGDDCLSVGHGVFSRVITILRIDRIERFGSSEPWMARRLGLKNLSVSVIGDSIQTGHFPTQLIDSAIDRIRSSL